MKPWRILSVLLLYPTAELPSARDELEQAVGELPRSDCRVALETFLAWQRDTGVPDGKVNVNGGAISIGHPLGASGARIMTTLLHAMEQRGARYAVQTMCEAGGLANATLLERL